MINIIIVEDEIIFSNILLNMLPKLKTEVDLLCTCRTISEAKVAIEKYKPHLVLLDVELPDGNGVDLLTAYEENGNFETIFITSHDKYAIDAIKKNATDYIVKPVKLNELKEAILKVKKRLDIYEKLLKVEALNLSVNKLLEENLQENKIMIATNSGAVFVKVSDIIALESESNYTNIYIENNKKIIASKTLSVFEELLEPFNFMRIHRSFIINLTKIMSINNSDGNYIATMKDNSQVEISRRKKKEFFEKIAHNV